MATLNDLEKDEKGETGFYVIPKMDCPHVRQLKVTPNTTNIDPMANCETCGETENWVCLHCAKILCSRYKNGHMREHCLKNEHHLVVSLTDFSCWCTKCDSYIKSKKLIPFIGYLHGRKFGITMPVSQQNLKDSDEEDEVVKPKNKPKNVTGVIEDPEEIKEFEESAQILEEKVKEVVALFKQSKSTVAYTGAGVSTSASIPDYVSDFFFVHLCKIFTFCKSKKKKFQRGPNGVWTRMHLHFRYIFL